MRGNFLCKPFNICGIGKFICVSLDKSDRHAQVFKRNLWWSDVSVPMLVLYWPIIEHWKVFPQSVLGEISKKNLVWRTSRVISKHFWKSGPVVLICALTSKTSNDTLTEAFELFTNFDLCFFLPPIQTQNVIKAKLFGSKLEFSPVLGWFGISRILIVSGWNWRESYDQIHLFNPKVGIKTGANESLGRALTVANIGQFALLGFWENKVNKRGCII
jgi:hypothetical protein